MKTILEIIVIVFVFSIVFTQVTTKKVLRKATIFCEKEVIIGKSSVDLLEKTKKAQLHFHVSSPDLMWIAFMGSYRPVFCYVSVKNGVITAKHIEVDD